MQDAEHATAPAGIVFAADFTVEAIRCGSASAARRHFSPVVKVE
jgi:hypothetical protein